MNLSRKLSLMVMVCVLSVLIPALLFFYYSSQKSLLRTEMAEIKNQTQLLVDIHRTNLIATHSSLQSLARLLSRELSQARPYAIDNFNRTMMRSDDGIWRNRREIYDGSSQAGLFLPIDDEPTDSDKSFYGTALDVFTKYGSALPLNGVADNVWMLRHDRSELIFDLSYPDFVYLMMPDTDYTTTPWMTLASPEQNPDRVVKWTPALFDDVSKTWMVSAVYPLDIDGQWRATLGHDIQLKDLFSLLYSQADEYKGEQHIIVDSRGGFILAGPWQQELEQNPETFELDPNETALIQVLQQPVSARAQLQNAIFIQGRSYQVVAISIEPMGWHYLRLVPTDEVLAPLINKTVHIGLIMIFTIFLLAVMINVAARKLLVNPLIMLTHRLRDYAQGKTSPQTQLLSTHDELEELSRAIDRMHKDLTEESQQIIKSERRYRRVINNVREVIVQIDAQGKWRFLSSVWKSLTGYEYRSSLNKSVVDFVHPVDRVVVQKTLESLITDSINSWQGELRMMTEDKRYVWVDMSLQRNRDADSNSSALIVGTVENIHLIRLRRTINDTLRTAEQMVLASACSVDVVLDFICNEMVHILDVDLFWIKLCQAKDVRLFSAGEGDDFLFDERGIWSGLHESDSPVMRCIDQAELIRVTVDSDLSSTWQQRLNYDCLLDNVFLPFCFGNEMQGVIGVQTVTVKRFDRDYQSMLSSFSANLRLICQLAEDQHMMRLHQAAVEKTANAIMITNADGAIEWVNHAFERYSMYCLDEVIGQTPRLLKSSEQPQGYAKNIWQTISSGNVWQGELVNRRKDGSLVYIFQTITPLVDAQGTITHYIAVIEDISERKADQERIAFMATHDELTDLPNRNLLSDRLNQAIAQSQRHQTKMAVLFIDLDQFKIINDSL
ncbi:MAG: PAS domain S-box protein, partial [Gammaproteobacteria bacterium]|nr:PAS domain S-box protein [Gammaproteobacteria bacterium]